MRYREEEYQRFKHLLEYFVAHLEHIANDYSDSSIGYEKYIKPLVEGNNFKSSGQGYNGQAIQSQVNGWDKYQNGQICINVYGANYQSRGTYLNWQGTGVNIMADWHGSHIENLYMLYYNPDTGERSKKNVSFVIKDLGLFDGQVPNENIISFFDEYNKMIETIYKERAMMKIDKYIDLLEANKNLILTGAPGTGKTYMAKEIAKAMGAEVGFVQFHPSYDYTDFVEGLRPKNDENGNVGFERKDGVFKEFCKKSFDVIRPSRFNEGYEEEALNYLKKYYNGEKILTHKQKKYFHIKIENGKIYAQPDSGNSYLVDDDTILKYLKTGEYNKEHQSTYPPSIGEYIKQNIYGKIEYPAIGDKVYIFIIDEINRGEISKIFGELFFSIDPGYRGEKGKVNTQYQNMVPEGDVFKNGFYVPENVYIIGTMNDIDRSVESMDFAMRRRFAWQEVTAEESYTNMIEQDPEFALVKDEIKSRMFNLNKAIVETEGLDEAYQIGAAYFRKYLDYQDKTNPFDCLWENHLKGLLFEYLRGNRRAKELLEKLHDAYNKKSLNE